MTNEGDSLSYRPVDRSYDSEINRMEEFQDKSLQSNELSTNDYRLAVELIEGQRAEIVGIATINMDDNDTTRKLKQHYKCCSVLKIE